ncbi:MAG: hypothetical protein PHX38_09685 [Sulfuricella sp.]|nr:hypothetical protein [Sulfuricella sp.]
MTSMVQKITGTLILGPAKHETAAEVYDYMRVGATYLKHVKVVGALATLLRNGRPCTLWVATIKTPTPFLFKTEIRMVYAVEIGGVVHKAVEEVRREWATSRTLSFFMLLGAGAAMILFYIGLLFWINALRLPFASLPLDEMRREPA